MLGEPDAQIIFYDHSTENIQVSAAITSIWTWNYILVKNQKYYS